MTKFYITKYATTKGIEVIDAEEVEWSKGDPKHAMISGKSKYGLGMQWFYGEGIEWHRTPESAIKSAEKKLAKLRAMKFEISN